MLGVLRGGGAKTVENCYNSGHIISLTNAGGINGGKTNGWVMSFVKCYNTGKVEGTNSVAGICASNWVIGASTFDQCYNLGDIIGNTNTAGITGPLQVVGSKVSNCYNFGSVTGSRIAGIVWGNNDTVNIISCYNVGELNGTTKYGISFKGKINNCYFLTGNGTATGDAIEVSSQDLKNLATTLDKSFTIAEENNEVTLSDTEVQGVWKNDTNGINEGYPVFTWQ